VQSLDQPTTYPAASSTRLPRLMPREHLDTYDAHVDCFGPRPRGGTDVIDEVERAGLRGHGGAGFPTATKLAAVARQRRRGYVVVNATEGEPMSAKDKTLCATAPHLVLDGAAIAAETIGALEVVVCVDRSANRLTRGMTRVLRERERHGADTVPLRLETAPNRYVGGEESALVRWLNGFDAKPTFVPPRPFEKGVGNRPTLVQNAETLAHLALIARYGAGWFRGLGTHDDPGSALVTVSGAVAQPGIFEIPLGLPLPDLVAAAGGTLDASQAVLIGGYFGTWVRSEHARRIDLDASSLRTVGASFGCGVLVAMPSNVCGLAESANVARWLASENAGQCGPCVNGLPAIAHAMGALVAGDRDGRAEAQLRRWLEMVKGRGACKHPDGVARFVASSLDAFAEEIRIHRRYRRCPHPPARPVLATPAPGAWR
jgi:NADH:ubiquinone oxidoreductase subunit F (NADH-binding)